MKFYSVATAYNIFAYRITRRIKAFSSLALLPLLACLPNLDIDHTDLTGYWQGKTDDSAWCMELDGNGRIHYKATVPKVDEYGFAKDERLEVDVIGDYTIETGGRFTIKIPLNSGLRTMPFLLAKVTREKLVYYDGQEAHRLKFISERVESCKDFLSNAQIPARN